MQRAVKNQLVMIMVMDNMRYEQRLKEIKRLIGMRYRRKVYSRQR